MRTIGLTGGIASGKSTVGKILKNRGIKVLSADEFAHHSLEPEGGAYAGVLREFGVGILASDGQINRKKLGAKIFRDADARRSLETIVWPVVIETVEVEIKISKKEGIPLLVVEVPLLYESGMEKMFDQVWVVNVSPEEQVKRLMIRDRLTPVEARQRIEAQMPLTEKARRADVVIDNNGVALSLEEQVDILLKIVE